MRPPDPLQDAQSLSRRVHQQEMIAAFGCFALRGAPLQEVLDEACRVVAVGLEVRFTKVLEWEPATGDFLMRAGVGWRPGVVGHARLGGRLESPAGYAFHTGEPQISNDLSREDRFRTPALLMEHGIRSAINVLVSDGTSRFGVLEADSLAENEKFDHHDLAFLQSLANVVAASVVARRREDALRDREGFITSVLAASPDAISVLDDGGALLSINEAGLRRLEIEDADTVRGRPWSALWPPEIVGKAEAAVAAARAGRTANFEAPCPTAKGKERWWNVYVAPLLDGSGARTGRTVAISRDITPRVSATQAKDALLQEKDLLMQEIHHRVKNSLQLVQSLLRMHGRATEEETVRRHLAESAARVRTIAAIHDRLYRTTVTPNQRVEVGPYLSGLIEDLRDGMLADTGERLIHLEADTASWAVSDVPTLGLVLTELVTNAVKYGRGSVHVRFRAAGPEGAAELVVEDEGPACPPRSTSPARAGSACAWSTGCWGTGAASSWIARWSIPASWCACALPHNGRLPRHPGFGPRCAKKGQDRPYLFCPLHGDPSRHGATLAWRFHRPVPG